MQQFEQWLGGLPTRRLQGDACRSILDALQLLNAAGRSSVQHNGNGVPTK